MSNEDEKVGPPMYEMSSEVIEAIRRRMETRYHLRRLTELSQEIPGGYEEMNKKDQDES